jgi:Kef-type K+ transport system membrane component KefB
VALSSGHGNITPMHFTESFLVFRETVSAHPVFALGILLAGGWLLGILAERFRIPSVTGFILAGMLLGPGMTGMVHGDLYEKLQTVTGIAVAVVAVVIGSELNMARIRKIRRAMATITSSQLVVTFLMAFAGLSLTGMIPSGAAALLAAIATATSPTATVAIVRDLKARGEFIDHLYGAIPLDDAGCILIFASVVAFSAGFTDMGSGSVPEAIVHFSVEMAGSVILGLLTGMLIRRTTGRRENRNSVYIISLGLVCLMTALARSFHLSPLLAGISAGAVIANSHMRGRNVIEGLERLSPPLYAVFFAIAGTELDPAIFGELRVVVLGGVYIIARAAGKYSGVWLGAALSRSHSEIRRYLGLAMLPHSGVTVGLLLYLQSSRSSVLLGDEITALVVSIVLMSVFINELLGPVLSRYAIIRGTGMEGRD